MGINFLEMYFRIIHDYTLLSPLWSFAFWRRFWFLIGFANLFCYASRATGESVLEVYVWIVFEDALAT